MRGESQAMRLEKMMQKQHPFPVYELALPLMQIKKKSLKKLSKKDILLLGLSSLELVLLSENKLCAKVMLNISENNSKIEIIEIESNSVDTYDSKKYEILKCSFGKVQSRKLEIGHTLGITALNLNKVDLIIADKNIAKCSLVNVDEEIAIEIEKVMV